MDYKTFKELHQQKELLLIGNVWNAQSAKVMEKLNVKTLGTSSAAVAATLGYSDGENMSFEEYLFIIKRIKASTTTPLSVDLEAGYGKTEDQIIENLKCIAEIGVLGINIEDSVMNGSVREIVNAEDFANKVERIINKLRKQHIDLFINLRCDAFLLNVLDARKEAIRRITLYEKSGVDGIFLPCITDKEDIKATVESTSLPINVMCMPGLPDFDSLKLLGVKRISMGNFVNSSLYSKLEEMTGRIISDKSFSGLF